MGITDCQISMMMIPIRRAYWKIFGMIILIQFSNHGGKKIEQFYIRFLGRVEFYKENHKKKNRIFIY